MACYGVYVAKGNNNSKMYFDRQFSLAMLQFTATKEFATSLYPKIRLFFWSPF